MFNRTKKKEKQVYVVQDWSVLADRAEKNSKERQKQNEENLNNFFVRS